MLLKNTETQYGAVTKTFHWTVALIVLCLLPVGLFMGDLPNNITILTDYNLKLTTYGLHKSLGITVLALMICRICWHIISHRPNAVETLKPWEKISAAAVHYSLYFLLLAMPLTGWLMSSAAGRSVNVFGLFTLPDLVPVDKIAAGTYRERHEMIGYIIMGVVGLHIAAALKHHFIARDSVLKRMLPVIAAAIILLLPSPSLADARQWTVIHEKSSITFRPKQMGNEFKGSFDLFSANIAFEPDNLAASKVAVDIHVSSAHTQAADRDELLAGKDWFDAAQFPDAAFETKAFRKTGDGAYEADGTLTIRNIAIPVVLPFRLNIAKKDEDKEIATMDGSIVLDRSKFHLGTGQWVDAGIIANEVPVDIHLTAVARINAKK